MNIDKSKKEFDEITKQFDTLVINDQKFQNIKQSLGVLNENLKQTMIDYNCHLIGNNTYEFKFDDKLSSEIFGSLIVVLNFIVEIIFNFN